MYWPDGDIGPQRLSLDSQLATLNGARSLIGAIPSQPND